MYEYQKKITWSSLKSGIVITIALLILFSAVFFSGNITSLFTSKFDLTTKFPNVQGLRTGAPVWLFGVEVGTVEKITINSSGTYVKVSIDRKFLNNIYKNAYTNIMTMGILGDKFIEVYPGDTSNPQISPGDTISGDINIGFEQLLSLSASIMVQLDSTINQLESLVSSILNPQGSVGKFISDPALYNNLNESINAMTKLTRDINLSNGTFSKFIKDTTLYHNLNSASIEIASLMNQVDNSIQNGSVAGALLNDRALAADVKETVNSLRTAVESLNK
ncbi:MAG TPA: MlaD family protein, partial [Chitinispirillaceae bacterium]|nr:MlaD family protein [Chitinispirillaceae bacterium]